VDDLAQACMFLMENYHEPLFINVGSGSDIDIKSLALMIKEIVDYSGDLKFDVSKPDGTPRKLMDSSRLLSLGFENKINLRKGITEVYADYVKFLAQKCFN